VYPLTVAKTRQIFVCRSCGAAQSRWVGKCPDCGEWDSLDEERTEPGARRDPQRGIVEAWATLQDGGAQQGGGPAARPLDEVDEGEGEARLPTGIGELDRVLGGEGSERGLVPGSVVLIGGSPGIGKSTLLLQAAGSIARSGQRVLYVSSEESARQIRARADRVARVGRLSEPTSAGKFSTDPTSDSKPRSDAGAGAPANLYILSDTNLARIVEQTRKVVPTVLIIDSIQMIYKSDLPAAPGSITQLRRCCAELTYLAKMSGIAVLLVGHVTKDGQLAGPRLLEHLVDTVLSFEGDRYHAHRLVRGIKNRFGTTQEIGIFEMTGEGLREVPEGAGVPALQSADGRPTPGSVVCPVMTGTRCVLVEVQALTATGFLGAAKRKSSGLDANRLAMIIAVLEQHAELRLADRDIFASAVGGVKVVEPASDLALLLAIAGAHLRRALAPATAVAGEVGLGGEVRPVTQLEQRIREAARLGYRRLIVPGGSRNGGEKVDGIEVVRVKTIGAAIGELG
jgi:DNA repair protein RadA/Sms